MCSDRLSDLPQDVIENILIRIPIREAVRTSLLASNWRYKWTTITKLVFDKDLVKNKQVDEIELQRVVKFVTYTLFLHKGPIHRFELSISALIFRPDVYNWILHLSRNEVEELILDIGGDNNNWCVPSFLFNCEKLTHLRLSRCTLHRPRNFLGFLSLKILRLDWIYYSQEDIEFLISSCPLLEILTLSYITSSNLHIDAPMLKCLTLEGKLEELNIVNTPFLTSVKFNLHSVGVSVHHLLDHPSNFDKFLGAMPLLGKLVGDNFFVKYLSVGLGFKQLSVRCNHLALIELYKVFFGDIEEMKAVICLLLSSPILHTLVVSDYNLESDPTKEITWDTTNFPKGNLERLRHVTLADMLGSPNVFLFVQFLLDRSPILEKLKISTKKDLKAEERNKVFIELLGFRRVSTRAQIEVFEEPWK